MALSTHNIPFLTALRSSWSGPGSDYTQDHEEEFRLDIDEEFVTLIHKEARPTNPYFLKIRIQDIEQLADMLDRKKDEK